MINLAMKWEISFSHRSHIAFNELFHVELFWLDLAVTSSARSYQAMKELKSQSP
jgi:hypothetical protein